MSANTQCKILNHYSNHDKIARCISTVNVGGQGLYRTLDVQKKSSASDNSIYLMKKEATINTVLKCQQAAIKFIKTLKHG